MNALAAQPWTSDLPALEPVLARSVSILGCTGSIGVSTLDVIAHARANYGPHAMPVVALTAQSNVKKLAEQARAVQPRLAVIGDENLFGQLRDLLAGTGIEIAAGRAAIVAAAARPSDLVMMAIVGAAAVEPALAAVARGATIALANKECIVAAGSVFRAALAKSDASIIPVDSEHNAVFQVLNGADASEVERVTLTASGGPFRQSSYEAMKAATPEQAVAHPNWSMGAKISVDSATLMNKGLELIEAHFLFGLPPEQLAAIVHPQSVVHCLVSYEDGSWLAHLSAPDMRTPICHALAWPRRIGSPSKRLNLAVVGQLTFEEPDHHRFPALNLALDSMRAGGLAPTVLNAANEIAVDAFLNRRIGFLDISSVVDATIEESLKSNATPENLEAVLAADTLARRLATDICKRFAA